MPEISSVLQFPNDPFALAEWFVFSIALVVIVTAIYVFVLNRSTTPKGETVEKLEQSRIDSQKLTDPDPTLVAASQALQNGDFKQAVEYSVRAVGAVLSGALANSGTREMSSMSISDMAYLVQMRAKSSPQIAQPVYQLNSLRLKAIQNQPIEHQEASWAVSFANWLVVQVRTEQIKI